MTLNAGTDEGQASAPAALSAGCKQGRAGQWSDPRTQEGNLMSDLGLADTAVAGHYARRSC